MVGGRREGVFRDGWTEDSLPHVGAEEQCVSGLGDRGERGPAGPARLACPVCGECGECLHNPLGKNELPVLTRFRPAARAKAARDDSCWAALWRGAV